MILNVSLTPSRKSASLMFTCVCKTMKNILMKSKNEDDEKGGYRYSCYVIRKVVGNVNGYASKQAKREFVRRFENAANRSASVQKIRIS